MRERPWVREGTEDGGRSDQSNRRSRDSGATDVRGFSPTMSTSGGPQGVDDLGSETRPPVGSQTRVESWDASGTPPEVDVKPVVCRDRIVQPTVVFQQVEVLVS